MTALPGSGFQIHQQIAMRNWPMIALADVQQTKHSRGIIGITSLRRRH